MLRLIRRCRISWRRSAFLVAQPFAAANLSLGPIWWSSGMPSREAILNLNTFLISEFRFARFPRSFMTNSCAASEVLVVAGTHGKTTTTSMLAWIFHSAGMQPSFLIGGIAENFGSSFALGEGKHFIIEGDEYDTAFFDKGPKFLHYFPDAVILTSVEFDHADIYKDLDAVETAFKRLVNLVPRRGRIVALDTMEKVSVRCLAKAFCPVERYGNSEAATWRVSDVRFDLRAPHGQLCTTASPGPTLNSRWPANTT